MHVNGIVAAAGAALVGAGLLGTAVAAALDGEPARVTGASTALDLMENGSQIGPPLVASAGTSTVALLLPRELTNQTVVVDAITAPNQVAQEMAAAGEASANQLRAVVEPLARLNPALNAGIEAVAGPADAAADVGGDQIQPLDTFTHQTATFLRAFRQD